MRQTAEFLGSGSGRTQVPFPHGSRALSAGVGGGGGFQEASPVPMASSLLATRWDGLIIIKVLTEL